MTDGPKLPSSGTISFLDLEAEDVRRQTIERRRARLRKRISDAFDPFPPDSPEWETAKLVRDFLGFVSDNIDYYRTRTRVQNPHTGEFIEEEWVRICGATIGALEAPERIRQLILELVAALIPDEDPQHRAWLAKAANLTLRARASADDIKALQKKGIMASFAGKLLVDSKHLVSEHDRSEAEAYFASARTVAMEIEESPYQTKRDHKFIHLLRKSYNGGLDTLVDAQQQRALAEIKNRSVILPQLERTLREMMETPFGQVSSRSMEDWFISARIAFQNESFIFMRLDEFRNALKRRLAELEAEPLLNPEAALEEITPKLRKYIAPLVQTLEDHSAGWSFSSSTEERLDVFQVVRSNAALLGKAEVVDPFNAFISDRNLLEQYARYKHASFKRDEPDLRKKLHSDLIMWDEIFRSAPLSDAQRTHLDLLRENLISPLEEAETALPVDIRQAKMLLPFGGSILKLLKTANEFTAFQDWLEKVQRVYNDRLQSEDELEIAAPEALYDPTPIPERNPLLETKQWAPTLVDVSEPGGESDRPSDAEPAKGHAPTEEAEHEGESKEPPRGKIKKRSSVGWLRKWLKGK
jgi:hypothetical protein